MIQLHPQYITDTAGQQLVVLTQAEYKALMEELDEAMDIHLYDQALREDDGERISLDDYLKKRKEKNG
ncbi:MAG: hypothetical protein J7539_04895 [Niabella sp.]|nr:hypothetical protein [Niabella sp.]